MIEIRDIKKKYGRCPVLNGVSLTIERGSCVGIIGSNGSGKSTLLEILAGVIRPDTGAFLVDEKMAWAKQIRKKIGYVPQANPLMEELTAWDNICLWNEKADLKQALGEDGALHMLGVDQYLKKPIYKMSGGMKKRVSIASALISKPEILLLDEPSAALDLEGKERLDEEKILPWIYATDLAFFPSHSHGLYHYDWSHPNPVPTVLLQHFSIREGAEDGNRYRGPGIRHLPRIRN